MKIAVVSVARSDYSILRPVLHGLRDDPAFDMRLIVTGMHLSPEFGLTCRDIQADGFTAFERVEMLVSSDSPEGIAKSVGLGAIGFGQVFGREPLDMLMIMGDRFEMLAATVAALPFGLPIAHIHGGELSEGAIDDAIRHSITKMSHLHFASTDAYGRRIRQLGEEGWRITVSGAPALDNLRALPLLSAAALEARFGLDLSVPPLLVTVHPTTLEYDRTEADTRELLAALQGCGLPLVFTYPNADTEGRKIKRLIEGFAADHPGARIVPNFGTEGYYSMLRLAAAMIGNSSSGIIEAASFHLPVVNIGNRQRGRLCGANVLHARPERDAIAQAIARATSPDFRAFVRTLDNIYGDGTATGRILDALKAAPPRERLLQKRFQDSPAS